MSRAKFVIPPEILHKVMRGDTDSLDIGTPGKGGAIKVYGNTSNPEEFKRKIDNAVEVLQYARKKMGVE